MGGGGYDFLLQRLVFYQSYHSNVWNKVIHVICVSYYLSLIFVWSEGGDGAKEKKKTKKNFRFRSLSLSVCESPPPYYPRLPSLGCNL